MAATNFVKERNTVPWKKLLNIKHYKRLNTANYNEKIFVVVNELPFH